MAKLITRKPVRWFEFAFEEGAEPYRVPLVQSLPNRYVVDDSGKFNLTMATFRDILREYVGAEVVDTWTVEEIAAVFSAWDDASGEGPNGVSAGE